MKRFLNTTFRSLLIACLAAVPLILLSGDLTVGTVVVAVVCGLIYFFWHRRRPEDYEPRSWPAKLIEGLIRLARVLVISLIVVLIAQPRGDLINPLISLIGGFGGLLYLPWFVFVRETKAEEQERKQRQEEERRNRKPGFWDKFGAFIASGMASNQGSSSGSSSRPRCPTCGGKGTVRCPLPDAGMGRNCPMCHGKQYIHCTACGGRGWLYS